MINYTEIPLSAIPSPKDERDYKVTKIIPMAIKFPVEFSLDFKDIPVKQQGQISSCVAHSLAYCREFTEKQQSNTYKKFSVGFIYANRDASLGQYEGKGMIPRDALSNLLKYGDVIYDEFPFNDTYPIVKQKIEADKTNLYQKAYPYRISSYYSIDPTNINEIKSTLIQLGAVSIMIPIYESFYNKMLNNVIPIPDTDNEKLLGFHEMTIIGFTRYGNWIVLNSWSENWADKGKCYIPFSFPIQEAWAITDSIFPNGEKKINYLITTNIYFDNLEKANIGINGIQSVINSKEIKDKMIATLCDNKYYIEMNRFDNRNDANNYLTYLDKNISVLKGNFSINILYTDLIKKYKIVSIVQYDKDIAELFSQVYINILNTNIKNAGLNYIINKIDLHDRGNGKYSLIFSEFDKTSLVDDFINQMSNAKILDKSIVEIM